MLLGDGEVPEGNTFQCMIAQLGRDFQHIEFHLIELFGISELLVGKLLPNS